jgi:ADP-ribose pyrophosphatase YjhB (NUDIX family)
VNHLGRAEDAGDPDADRSPGRDGSGSGPLATRGPLPETVFQQVYALVPRLTVELVVHGRHGVLLTCRSTGPCSGLWHLPGGTVRFGEPLERAFARVAESELGVTLRPGPLLGYLEYPSHYLHGLDSPVGLAFGCEVDDDPDVRGADPHGWFTWAPSPMHAEQTDFLERHGFLEAGSVHGVARPIP